MGDCRVHFPWLEQDHPGLAAAVERASSERDSGAPSTVFRPWARHLAGGQLRLVLRLRRPQERLQLLQCVQSARWTLDVQHMAAVEASIEQSSRHDFVPGRDLGLGLYGVASRNCERTPADGIVADGIGVWMALKYSSLDAAVDGPSQTGTAGFALTQTVCQATESGHSCTWTLLSASCRM